MTNIADMYPVSRKRRSRAFHRAMAAVETHGRAFIVNAPMTPSGGTRSRREAADTVVRICRATTAVQR